MLKNGSKSQVSSFVSGQKTRASPATNSRECKSGYLGSGNELDQIVIQLVRNILNDPENLRIIAEYSSKADSVTQFPKPPEHRANYAGGHTRDISCNDIIRPRDLPQATGLSRTQCWRLSRDPTSGFPPKIRLSTGAVGFSYKAIKEWLLSREESNNEQIIF